jgi:hypothetical protein
MRILVTCIECLIFEVSSDRKKKMPLTEAKEVTVTDMNLYPGKIFATAGT